MGHRPTAKGFGGVAITVIAFGIAMGWLEGAVVVYLRAATGTGAATPTIDPAAFARYLPIEVVRELATLVMIAAVGWLAGTTRLERLAWAAVVFGVWDIIYYVTLNLTIGWPSSLGDWDLLFLVPAPWVGPVWAPIVVSLALFGFGLVAARRLRHGRPIVASPTSVGAGIVAGGLVIASFLVDPVEVLAQGTAPWTGWPLFWAGMALAVAATIAAIRGRPSLGS
ncbi:MAG: hypothetical protein AB1736_02480 [Chloroflexota bacterium]